MNSETPTENKSGYRVLLWLGVIILVVLAYRLGENEGRYASSGGDFSMSVSSLFGQSSPSEERVDMSLFWRSWDLLQNRYVDAKGLDEKKMVEGAIRGMMASTEDPYTTFLDEKESSDLEADISGSFEGIGAEIGIRDKILTVISPLSESPAEKAGLRAGDKILKINDEETLQMNLDDAVSKMRGKKGTDVTFTILRESEQETRQITVTRDRIDVKSVTATYKDGGIALVTLTRFGEETARDFEGISRDIRDRQVKGIVLDMRNNPGGLLQTAVELGGSFLEKGSVVVSEEYGNGKKDVEKTIGKGELKDIPVVVLINEGSASASEILAGALKDNRSDITLVGKKSFGKGSVQELIPLPKGTSAKITVAKWLTPSGRAIDHDGISPDVEVELSDEDFEQKRDPQLDRALELLR